MSESEQVIRRARRRRPRAGKRLRNELNAALEHARRELGQPLLEFSEQEIATLERAAAAADRAEELGWLYDEELAGERRPTVLVKLSGEIRLCERQVIDLIGRIHLGVGQAKSARHAYSANQRWQRGGGT
jgi:hypothetical protein